MKKEIQKRIEENTLKKQLLENADKSKQDMKNPNLIFTTSIQNSSLKPTSTPSQVQSSDMYTRSAVAAMQKSGVKKKTELVSIKKPQSVVSSKLGQTLKKVIPASSKFEKEAKLSQLRNLGVSIVTTIDLGMKTGRNPVKPSNWMEGLEEDVIEIEDEIMEIKPKVKKGYRIFLAVGCTRIFKFILLTCS